MTVGDETMPARVPPARSPDEPTADAAARRATFPTTILSLVSAVPAALTAGWLLVALPLVLFHAYRPLPAALLGLVAAALLGRPAVRAARAAATSLPDVPWWVLVGVLAVVGVFGLLAYTHSAGDVLIRRDPGSYAMSATWLSQHGTIQIPNNAHLFGVPTSRLFVVSQGFYQHGSYNIPQFMTGVPILMSIGGWLGGVYGILHSNAIIGSLALLAFAGLVARLVGPRWAVPAVAVLALAQPQLDVMRATYSEPSGQLLMLGGLVLLLDGLAVCRQCGRARRAVPRDALVVAGLVLGLVTLVRIDAIADLLPLPVFICVLAYRRTPTWKPLTVGLVVGLWAGAFDGVVLTLPYLRHVGSDLWDALALFGAVTVASAVVTGIAATRRGRQAAPIRHWPAIVAAVAVVLLLGVSAVEALHFHRWSTAASAVPLTVAAAMCLLVGAAATWGLARTRWRVTAPVVAAAALLVDAGLLVVRPYIQTVRADPNSGGAGYVRQVQAILHMPIDPSRSYYEQAARWLSWYLGWGTLALAAAGAAWLAYALTKRQRPEWMLPLLVVVVTTTLVLAKPSITPDHPWADRRFVPVVLPGLVLLASAAGAAIVRRASRISWLIPAPAFGAAAAVALAAVVGLPTYFGSRHVFTTQTEKGEVALVHQVCAAINPGDVVVTFGNRGSTEWPGTLRIMCGVSTAFLGDRNDVQTLEQIESAVQQRGKRLLVLVTSSSDRNLVPVAVDWGSGPVATLNSTESDHSLTKRPDGVFGLPFEVWLGQLAPLEGIAAG